MPSVRVSRSRSAALTCAGFAAYSASLVSTREMCAWSACERRDSNNSRSKGGVVRDFVAPGAIALWPGSSRSFAPSPIGVSKRPALPRRIGHPSAATRL